MRKVIFSYNFVRIVLMIVMVFSVLSSCDSHKADKNSIEIKKNNMTAKEILGNSAYQAISYGGYRNKTREEQPSLKQLKEDMQILFAMGIRIIRTYNVRLPHAKNVLKAISELKKENPDFEMYVMLGAWIDCKNAWTNEPLNHNEESEHNAAEVQRAVDLAIKYPDIVKIIAVGNEAMVKWATSYFVMPEVILKWVLHLQDLKMKDTLSKDLWITSSDNFASWGGGDSLYHTEDLKKLIHAVDYLSIHVYPMHDTHYNPYFWGVFGKEIEADSIERINAAMKRATAYAISQYDSVDSFMKQLKVDKPIHIGETGWASKSNGFYGDNGSKATDEYKQSIYYHSIRDWTNKKGVSCFYFEAFDEPWKDAQNSGGSENHFGLFTVEGQAKYALWKEVDRGIFKQLSRDGNPIIKTYNGNKDSLLVEVQLPPLKKEIKLNH